MLYVGMTNATCVLGSALSGTGLEPELKDHLMAETHFPHPDPSGHRALVPGGHGAVDGWWVGRTLRSVSAADRAAARGAHLEREVQA